MNLDSLIGEAVVLLYLHGLMGNTALTTVLGHDDAHAVRTAAAVVDDGEALATELAEG